MFCNTFRKRCYEKFPWTVTGQFLTVFAVRLRPEVIPQGRRDGASVHLSAEAAGGLHAAGVSELQHGADAGWRCVQVP